MTICSPRQRVAISSRIKAYLVRSDGSSALRNSSAVFARDASSPLELSAFDETESWWVHAQGYTWGWARFDAGDTGRNASSNFRADCLGCHIPAQNTDWIYVEGYPTLQAPYE